MKIQPVILCGGSGTRLWPLSREQYPKQLLALNGELTLLQSTVRCTDGMAAGAASCAAPLIVCNEEHRFMIAEQMRGIGVRAPAMLLEPSSRSTAPALTLAALHALADDDPVLLVLPSDHVIRQQQSFHQAVECGAALAAKGYIVAFGVTPTSAETGYGYICSGGPVKTVHDGTAHFVDSFVEKPDAETAQRYVASGSYLWNSGIFAMRASVWIDSIGYFRPEILAACDHAYRAGKTDSDFFRIDRQAFSACPADSIDYAVMERLELQSVAVPERRAVVVGLGAGWSDVGDWNALWAVDSKDKNGNAVHGDVCTVETSNSLLIAQHRLLACAGLAQLPQFRGWCCGLSMS